MDRRCDLPRVTRQLPPASKLSSPGCHTQVEETGCEILPDFADGAKLLVPISAGQLSDTVNDIIDLPFLFPDGRLPCLVPRLLPFCRCVPNSVTRAHACHSKVSRMESSRKPRREGFEGAKVSRRFSPPSIRCLDPLPPSLLLPALSVRVDFFHEQIHIPFSAASKSVSVALS